MNKRLRAENLQRSAEAQELDPKQQRLNFILLRVLLFLACIAVSVGIWLTVHYVEYLRTNDGQGAESAYSEPNEYFDRAC